jgi:hypothetical protein
MLPEIDDDDDDVVVKLLEATLNGTVDFNIKTKEQIQENDVREVSEEDEIIDVRMTMESLLINDQSDEDDEKDKVSVSSEKSAKKTVKFASGNRFVTALSISNGVPFDSLEPNQVIAAKVSDENDCDSVSLSN